ncbi:unnamed protein product [Diatraea saccharalis]|uniref:Uncharacterized protein n=1 Tax=Diatraea saccharalis TaxID=40085 RepID=A0A9N9R412_9NEOP|nr:unnamed protein product [Diatraea saccharalis]
MRSVIRPNRPFKVMELLDGDRYLLKALNSKRTYKYAHDRLRRMPEGQLVVEESWIKVMILCSKFMAHRVIKLGKTRWRCYLSDQWSSSWE